MKILLIALFCLSIRPSENTDPRHLLHEYGNGIFFEVMQNDHGDYVGILRERERTTTVKRYHHTGQFKYHCLATMSTGELKQVPVKKDDLHFLMLKIKGMHQQERMETDPER